MFTDDIIQQIDQLQKNNEKKTDYDPLKSVITPEWLNSIGYFTF